MVLWSCAQVAALDQTVAYHEALIEERDAGIAEIQRQIGEVNEMFQDLAVLINDQVRPCGPCTPLD